MADKIIELFLVYASTAVLLVFVYRKVWPSFIKSVEERKNQINNDLEQAEISKEEALENKKVYEVELKTLQEEKTDIINTTLKTAKEEKSVIIGEARIQAKEIISKSKEEALNEKGEIEKEIQKSTLEYVNLISSRFVAKNLTDEEELKMFEAAIKEAE